MNANGQNPNGDGMPRATNALLSQEPANHYAPALGPATPGRIEPAPQAPAPAQGRSTDLVGSVKTVAIEARQRLSSLTSAESMGKLKGYFSGGGGSRRENPQREEEERRLREAQPQVSKMTLITAKSKQLYEQVTGSLAAQTIKHSASAQLEKVKKYFSKDK